MPETTSVTNPFDNSLDQRLRHVLQVDRFRLQQFLRKIRTSAKSNQPFDRNLSKFIEQLSRSEKLLADRLAEQLTITCDTSLPIYARKQEIQAAIGSHQVVILCGETGSGKSTQLPLFLLEMGRGRQGVIGHTQPRRIAARSVASRVASELNSPLGTHVGFKVRFTDSTGPMTMVKVMTDGLLLAETQTDRYLNQYDTIIVDEAHERSLNIDFLLGYLKQLLPKRPDLRIIITSATIDAVRFADYFTINETPAPTIIVEGRTYPVELRYRPPRADENDRNTDWRDALTDALLELENEGMRDVLAFLPSERDIREAARILRGRFTQSRRSGDDLEILPLYGRLSAADQERIFQPHQNRRIVLATNVAESSITVPGIDAVVDLGLARISRYSPRAKMQRLPIEPISKASADQRKGRCGRVGPGICIRLYEQSDYESREEYTSPEILRTNLAAVVLQTMSLGLGAIQEFPFLDPPRAANINDGIRTLFELGAIDENDALTPIGRQLASLPVDPRIGRMILAGEQLHCLHEVLIIASVLEIQDPRDRPLDKQLAADEAHQKFLVPTSDFLSLLKLWNSYHDYKQNNSRSKLKKWCEQNYLSVNRMREWSELHQQLLGLCDERRLKVKSRNPDADEIHKALLTGLLSNIAYLTGQQEYLGAGGLKLHIWPGSVLAPGKSVFPKTQSPQDSKAEASKSKKPAWFMAAEIVETTKQYARTCAVIRPEWVEPISKHLTKKLHYDPFWDKRAGLVKAYQNITLFGLPIVTRRTVRYSNVNPEHAREIMIKEGIIKGEIELAEIDRQHNFVIGNQKLLDTLDILQAKLRRHDLLRTEDAQWDFYTQRIPADIVDSAGLQLWWNKFRQQQPDHLILTAERMLTSELPANMSAMYPDDLTIEHLTLRLVYKYEPGEKEDGVTLVVPRAALHQIPSQLLDWLVPGLVAEKIQAILKSLPKNIRVGLIPLNVTAEKLAAKMPYGFGPFYETLARELSKIVGNPVSVHLLQHVDLPAYLQFTIEVIDENKTRLAISRSLTDLQQKFPAQRETYHATRSISTPIHTPASKAALTTFPDEPLPESVTINRGGINLLAYPCLEDTGEGVNVTLAETADIARSLSQLGLSRLFLIACKKQLDQQIAHWPKLDAMELYGRKFVGYRGIKHQLKQLISRRIATLAQPLPRDKAAYEKFLSTGRGQIPDIVAEFTPVLTKMYEACLKLDQKDNDTVALHQPALFEIQDQRESLFPQDFLLTVSYPRLLHYPRYLNGALIRYDKLIAPQGVQKDRQRQQQLEPFWRQFLATPRPKHAKLMIVEAFEEYRWMIEEFRISLFAQELGTNGAISPQRLEKQWQKVLQLLKA